MRKTRQKPARKNYATPGEPMTEKEFLSFVKEAEEGPFFSEKEFRRKFEEWKKTLEK